MTKLAFLSALQSRLTGLPEPDVLRTLSYYSEMIDDRMEDGMSEEAAVAAMGSVDEIARQILPDTPPAKQTKAKEKSRRPLRGWAVALLILGAPVWIPLLLAAGIILLSVCIVLWSVVVALYAVNIILAAGAVAGIFGSLAFFLQAALPEGAVFLGAGLVCAGLAIFLFFGCRATVKGMAWLSKKIWLGVKACLIRKGDAQ